MHLAIIDSDTAVYQIAFSLQNGYGENAVLKSSTSHKDLCERLDNFIDSILSYTEASDYKCYLQGEGNFRLDEFPLYKANRSTTGRPILFNEARDYLINRHSAQVVNGAETDDVVASEVTELGESAICCSIDKDLDQVEGNHYTWEMRRGGNVYRQAKLYYINKIDALRNLYKQALTGDKSDNIMYYFNDESNSWRKEYGLSEAKARGVVQTCNTEIELYHTCLEVYDSFGKTKQDLINNMHQLYLIRRFNPRTGEPVRWKIPTE